MKGEVLLTEASKLSFNQSDYIIREGDDSSNVHYGVGFTPAVEGGHGAVAFDTFLTSCAEAEAGLLGKDAMNLDDADI